MILAGRPCIERKDTYFLLFNELTVIAYLYVLVGLSDFNTAYHLYERMGLILLGIVMFAFMVNLGKTLISFTLSALKFIRR